MKIRSVSIIFNFSLYSLLALFFFIPSEGLNARQREVPSDKALPLYLQDSDPKTKIPVTETADSVPVNLAGKQSSGQSIVLTAMAELHKGPESVGRGLSTYPYDLNRYLKNGEAWCSEFVSWAYKANEAAFTGGSEGGWMLKGSRAIKSWFQKHSRFITRSDAEWNDFVPQPGDYIRYDNDNGGHSGIVRYAEGDTLYTVEGNVGNLVRLQIIPDWRNRKEIDGFGIRERPDRQAQTEQAQM